MSVLSDENFFCNCTLGKKGAKKTKNETKSSRKNRQLATIFDFIIVPRCCQLSLLQPESLVLVPSAELSDVGPLLLDGRRHFLGSSELRLVLA